MSGRSRERSAAPHLTRAQAGWDSAPGDDLPQVTGLDAQWLALEIPRQSGHFSGPEILGPSTRPTARGEPADVQYIIAERPPMLAFRWRH
jgi:hypothetical protein